MKITKTKFGEFCGISVEDERVIDDQCRVQHNTGKSESIAMDIVLNATHKNTPMLYVVSSKAMGFDIIWRRIIDYSKFIALPIMKANKGSGIITWENGSELKLGSSGDKESIENLRGITRKCIYVDEAQKIKEPLRLLNEVLMPMTNVYGNDYKFIITGTPSRARKTWFQKTWESDSTWQKLEMFLEQNPAIKDPASLRTEKQKVMLPDQYEREYEHKFSYSTDVVLFPTITRNRYVMDELKPNKWGIGIDVGFSDCSALVGCLWNNKKIIAKYYEEGHWTTDIIAAKIKEMESKLKSDCKPYDIFKPARKDSLNRIIEEEVKITNKGIIVCDSANLLTIQDLRKYGINVYGSQKTKKLENLNALQVAIRDLISVDNDLLYEELEAAAWKENDAGEILDDLVTSRDNHLDGVHALLYLSREFLK